MPPAEPLARHPRLVMEGRLVAIDGDLPSALADALDAIPGAAVEVHGMSWARRVGPDRAQSLVHVAERHGVEMSDRARAGLEQLCRIRELSSPVIEVVTRDGSWLSLMDDWLSLAVEELRSVPGSRPRLPAGRVEVPLTPSTAAAIARTVSAHELRLSPAAELALGEIASIVEPPEPEARDAGLRWIARIEVERRPSGPLLRMTTRWGNPPAAIEQLEQLEVQSAQCSAPLTPRNLEVVGRILAAEREVSTAPGVAAALEWARENPDARTIPAAELELLDAGDGARLAVRPIWDEEPRHALAEQEAALLSRRRGPSPAGGLPAEAWPPETLARLIRIHRLACPPAVADAIQIDADADARRLIALSAAAEADVAVEGLGGELMPFQRAGVAYALERRRLFIADEQGLGKTIQALATIEADEAYPAVVICPASLKLNWQREIAAWLPARRTRSIGGRSPQALESADVLVINYEVVAAHLEALRTLAPQALVLDEAHYLKNPSSARTKAVLGLAESLGTDALRLALTGTPVVNRPAELAPQLRALDRLGEYGSAASFRHRYGSAQARRRLHQRLRSSCFLRRRKEDVLAQLPEKRRAVITVPLDNEAEYKRAERDFVGWLREQLHEDEGGALPPRARSRAIAHLTALRRLAARGKLAAALSWLDDFLESEERLVVFAHHRDIQAAILERFPGSARITGSDSLEEREHQVRSFQADDGPRLCVCSLEVASHGFTLTGAANVAFLELVWTPAKHDQAEDRVHRIGQTSRVTAWYLLAADTIDERMAALLERKRQLVDSLTDGGDGGGESLASAVLTEYAALPDGAPDDQATSE